MNEALNNKDEISQDLEIKLNSIFNIENFLVLMGITKIKTI